MNDYVVAEDNKDDMNGRSSFPKLLAPILLPSLRRGFS